ncbi:MauE/DoxX family redox-associated membrane protein [Paenibacillus caseinilyticus]|uniref:Methylamine utilisation protein MauE domain-containing protein n=1 Tax=Paenibacillus mucilaginosus K02 TaxID=997761 RepID=I0BKX6_9BACL|nr:MauE/DoxX family redox-associated membrane protein [Paenibacillus mucilaginosus]AFH63023.1 hypothetical protein B2K_20305 [Paenibacillus mucilaginosus K02]
MDTGLATIVVGLVIIFLLSAVMKLRDLPAFLQLVADYEVLPPRLSSLYGVLTPFLEIAGALMLLYPGTRIAGASLLLALLASFGGAVLTVMLSGRQVSCGCYGKWMESNADGFTLVKILLLFLLLVTMLVFPEEAMRVTWPSIGLGLLVALVFFVLQMIWNYYQENMKLF